MRSFNEIMGCNMCVSKISEITKATNFCLLVFEAKAKSSHPSPLLSSLLESCCVAFCALIGSPLKTYFR